MNRPVRTGPSLLKRMRCGGGGVAASIAAETASITIPDFMGALLRRRGDEDIESERTEVIMHDRAWPGTPLLLVLACGTSIIAQSSSFTYPQPRKGDVV